MSVGHPLIYYTQRQTANDLTGEHTCVMLRPLNTTEDQSWLGAFTNDFHRRFLNLLSYQFREFPSVLSLSIDESAVSGAQTDSTNEPSPLTKADLDRLLTPFDQKRLESYAKNLLDYHVILDMVPTLAHLYFTGALKSSIKLTGVQQAILLAVGLQRKDIDVVSSELSLPSSQLLAMFIKIMRKITTHFETLVTQAVDAEMPKPKSIGVSRENALGAHDDEIVDNRFVPLAKGLGEELEEVGDEALKEYRLKQKELIDSLPLDQ